ncbi:MAG: hypothetical protein AB1632_12040 [Nitrospirota bacterium]
MFWSLSFQLLPDEVIIDDSTRENHSGLKPAYSVFLTNKRAVFRFDGLGSSLSQSFFYDEIMDVKPHKRLFINYMQLKTKRKEFLLNIPDADYWSNKILSTKENLKESPPAQPEQITSSPKAAGKKELLDMLTVLRKNSLLTDRELEEKIHMLDSIKL